MIEMDMVVTLKTICIIIFLKPTPPSISIAMNKFPKIQAINPA